MGIFSGGDGNGFSIGGLGGKSGALGEWDVVGKELDKANPYLQSDRKAAKAKAESEARAAELYEKTIPLNQRLDEADKKYADQFGGYKDSYLNSANSLVNSYNSQINALKNEAQSQAKDAKATYTNTILPELKNAMGAAKVNASQAMTLAEAGDPNNPIMQAIRDLYNKQGQQARIQGQQDFGVLSGLGAQAAGMQFGAAGNPMTSGQMGQIYAANQAQAGDAYARAQQRMYDLQQQGIDRGFDQSNLMYQLGQDAQGRYSNTIKDIDAAEANYLGKYGMLSDQIAGYAGDVLGTSSALNADKMNLGMMGADIAKSNAYAGTGREQNTMNQLYGAQQQISNNDLQAALANNAAKGQFISSLVGLGAGAMGAKKPKQPEG